MKRQFKYSAMASLILAISLTACGGSSTTAGSDTPPPATITLSGTAATGAPFDGADISIFDKTNTKVGTGKTAADGSYTVTLSAGATPPFVLQAVRDDLTLVSIAAADSGSTINITSITNLIASRLSTSGDPAKLAAELQANPTLLDPVTVQAKVDEIVALLKPLLDAVGATANPLTGKFVADGTGSDRALDSLLITITAAGPNSTNIAVAVKQQAPDGEQPALVQFTNASAPPATLPAIDAASLVPSGTAPLIAALLQRMTACFALPAADRVNTPNPTSPATASDIKADACKTIFYHDDPTLYKSGGKRVGTGPKTSFGAIFKDGGTGMAFDRGNYAFTRANGDLVVAYRSTDQDGNVLNDTFAVRTDNSANPAKLGLIGNQNDYEGSVVAYQQLREFPKDPAYDYYSTGYVFSIPNNGNVQKVIVTSPKGNQLTLVAGNGTGNLTFLKHDNSGPSGSNFLRLRAVYADAANSGNPADIDTSQFFADTRVEDADIAGYAAQSTWKIDYYTGADIGSATLAATQYHKTLTRPLTVAELQTQGLASLTPDVMTELKSELTATGLPLSFTGPAQIEWVVPNGALAPTQIKLFGRLIADKSKIFDDSANVGSNARAGAIYCAPASPSDTHCDANGNFASGREATGLHLWARDPASREFGHHYAFYGLIH